MIVKLIKKKFKKKKQKIFSHTFGGQMNQIQIKGKKYASVIGYNTFHDTVTIIFKARLERVAQSYYIW